MVDKVVVVYNIAVSPSYTVYILYLVKSDTVSPPTRHLHNISSGFKAVLPRHYHYQRWSRGHKARGQGQGHKKKPRPRPRTAFPRTDTLEAKDRNARGQGQGHKRKCSPKSQKFFRRSQKKKRSSQKFF